MSMLLQHGYIRALLIVVVIVIIVIIIIIIIISSQVQYVSSVSVQFSSRVQFSPLTDWVVRGT